MVIILVVFHPRLATGSAKQFTSRTLLLSILSMHSSAHGYMVCNKLSVTQLSNFASPFIAYYQEIQLYPVHAQLPAQLPVQM